MITPSAEAPPVPGAAPDPADRAASYAFHNTRARLCGEAARRCQDERDQNRYLQARSLFLIREDELWREGGYPDARAWLEGEHAPGERQRRRYREVARLGEDEVA